MSEPVRAAARLLRASAAAHRSSAARLNRASDGGSDGPSRCVFSTARAAASPSRPGSRTDASSSGTSVADGDRIAAARTVGKPARKSRSDRPLVLATAYGFSLLR